MSDLQQTDAQFLRFMREGSFFWRLSRRMEESRRRHFLERTQILNLNDVTSATPHFTALTLTGIQFGTNTTEAGFLFARITVNGPNFDVRLFEATGGGGGDEVAQAINVAASATAALVAVNASGITGSVTLGATIVAEIDDKHQLQILADDKLELLTLWPSDGTTDDDTASRSAATRLLTVLTDLDAQKLEAIRASYEEWALSAEDNPDARGNAFLRTRETSLLRETPITDASGSVIIRKTGHYPTLSDAMEQNTVGSEQDIIERVTAATAGVFSTNNDGQGTVAPHTPEQKAPAGRWTFRCIAGLGSDAGGLEEFEISFKADEDDDSFTVRSRLRIKQSFTGERGFGVITLLRTRAKTGDAGNTQVGAASTFSETGEREINTDTGTIYGRTIDEGGALFSIEWYKSAARNIGDLVAKAANVPAGAVGVQATAQQGSGLTVTFDVGSAPVGGTANYSLDMNFFSIENSTLVPDEFTIDTTETSSGRLAKILADVDIWLTQLNGDTAGSEQLDDDALATVNTFPARITIDI